MTSRLYNGKRSISLTRNARDIIATERSGIRLYGKQYRVSALGATIEVDEGVRGGGDELEVVSRESPVVIVVIKWRLAGGFASVVCIRRGSEGNIGMGERSRGMKKASERRGSRERKRKREQKARVRDRRSRVAVDMKHPSMKQAPSLSPYSLLSLSLSLRLFLIPSSPRRLLAPLTTPAYTHSPSNASTFSLPCTYPP